MISTIRTFRDMLFEVGKDKLITGDEMKVVNNAVDLDFLSKTNLNEDFNVHAAIRGDRTERDYLNFIRYYRGIAGSYPGPFFSKSGQTL